MEDKYQKIPLYEDINDLIPLLNDPKEYRGDVEYLIFFTKQWKSLDPKKLAMLNDERKAQWSQVPTPPGMDKLEDYGAVA